MAEAEELRTVPTYKDILDTVCEELNKVSPSDIELIESTDITTDLNVDSVAVMDLLFALEEHYDISVPLNELGEVRTVGQLARLVQQMAVRS
jgi:acyl carrier protein